MTHRSDLFFCMTLRIELFEIWLGEMNFFFSNMTQRIDFFDKNDSKNWIFFFEKRYLSKNWCFFLNMTQRIEFFSMQRIELFFNMTQRIELFFLNWTQRVELFYWIWLKEFNLFFFLNWTQRVEPFYWVWLKELNLFFEYHSKNHFWKRLKDCF